MNSLIESYGLTKTYKSGKLENPVLQDINLEIRRSEIISIMGPSGCGKTTLLNLLGGLDRPTSGSIFLNGRSLTEMSDSELTRFRLRNIGIVFQFFNLIPTLTAVENVRLPLLVSGHGHIEERARPLKLLDQVGLLDKANRMPYELSGGEQQRVAVARALANEPTIVLADEPTGNLDSKTSAELIDLINIINKENGQTFVIVTHDTEVAEVADRIIYMKDGRIVDNKRIEEPHCAIETFAEHDRLKIQRVLDDLDELYISNIISRGIYERLRAEYINRLIEIELNITQIV
jgi:putative ABC transport system ATP-binding protein